MLSLTDNWIKAAVEHRVLNIDYFSRRTKQQYTNRDVEPDFVGISRDGRNMGLWATFCHLRKADPRRFQPDSMKRYFVTSKRFDPSSAGRWRELIPPYKDRGLENKNFGGDKNEFTEQPK